ncbi:probable transcriptional regulator SLK2 [Pistacia vera]|uniref:probable transcriptional regulator SLK2 n=1 Tax=Pistacia vera TaxID=55513 RepID=UPI001262C8DF|nr:probable transcriptional regulator SLK2 [Pistacia vera]
MAFGALSDSKYQLALCFKAMTQQQSSNSESVNSLQKDGHYQAVVTSLLNVSSGNFPASVGKVAHMNECMVSKKTNPTLVNETANFQPSMLSSFVPEGSSAVSTHANSDVYSYLNIPPLPLPMLPSCLSSSGTSNFGLENSQTHKRRRHRGGAKLDRATTTAVHKKARLEMEQEAIQQHQNVLQYDPKLDGGVCSRRIMQYMYHLRHRPSDNGIAFWRKLVTEYFAPCAKKRWCLSSYDDVERYAPGVFPQNTWQCDVCGCKSGRGFEANLEALPRLNKIMFESGVIDELLYLDLPCELIQFSGLMTLEYGKAVQESVYEQFRVVREGKLCISFTSDLKILSWEFCAWHHEELLPRNLVAPQINKLVHTVQSYQSSIDCGGWDGVSPHDLQANCNVFLVGGCQLVRNLELQPVDNLGFSKRYVRCLQISEIINSMKDLITFSMDKNIGPIESLKCYSQENRTTKPQEDEPQRKESDHYPSVGRRKLMATSLFNNDGNEKSDIPRCGPMTASEEALVSPGYYTRLLGRNSFNSDMSKVMPEHSSSCIRTKLGASPISLGGLKTLNTGNIKDLLVDGLSSSHSSGCKQKTENNLIQKLLQEMINNSRTAKRGSELDKVHHKRSSSTVADLPAAMDDYKVAFNDSQAALGNATNNTVGKFNSVTAAASDVDHYGIYGNGSFSRREHHLPEVTHSIVSGFNSKTQFLM